MVCRYWMAPYEPEASVPSLSTSNPRFAGEVIPAAEATHLQDEELVIGTIAAGQPRAYPIGYLQVSEHVNDNIGGLPVLATW